MASPPTRFCVVPGSVDLARFDVKVTRLAARRALGWPTDRPILIAVRRLTERMGLEVLIEAMKRVVRAVPEALLLIAGKGRIEARLERQIEDAGLQRHVRLLGFVPDDDLPLAYRAADINVVPSLALEGFGLTAAEALAAGAPSMVTAVGGLPEVVTDSLARSRFPVRRRRWPRRRADLGASRRTQSARRRILPGLRRRALQPCARRRAHGRRLSGARPVTRSILFISHTGQLGGAEIMLLAVARKYRERCRVLLFADGPLRQRLAALGVPVELMDGHGQMLRVARKGGRLQALSAGPAVLRAALRLARAARGYDILYPNSQKAAVVAMLAGAMARKPVIWYLHDILSRDHFSGLHRRAVVTLANWTTRWVLTNSQASLDAFVASGGDKSRSSIAPCGIDCAPFDAVSDAEAQAARSELNLAGAHAVGLFGRITPWKGQHALIEALPRLDGVHAVIVGDALFGEESYRAELLALAQKLGVADRVHWLGFRQDVPRLMRAVDVVLHASVLPEPFGQVIVEGMMARRPVIAADLGASREILGENYEYLFQPGDPAALAAAIEKVRHSSPAARAALIDANYARARELFSPQRMIGEIDKALERAR